MPKNPPSRVEAGLRRKDFLLAMAAGAAGLATGGARAQAGYPSQPIKLIIPFAPGGSSDIVGRLFGQYLAEYSKQSVIAENKAGANGILGTQFVKSAPADGHTLLVSTNTTHAANVSLFKKLPYDAMKDFEHIGAFGTSASVAVVPKDSRLRTLADLVAFCKANPGKVFYGHYNSASQMTAAVFSNRSGAPMTGVPYKAIGNAVTDLMGGQIQVLFMEYLPGLPQVRSGAVHPLAVTGARRYKAWPQVPAIAETYPGYEIGFHLGLAAPAGTPPAVVQRLHNWLQQALQDAAFRQRLDDLGMEAMPMSREEYIAYSQREISRWADHVKAAGVEPQ